VRGIIQYPTPILTQVSKPVKKVTPKVREIAAELLFYLDTPGCVGLSAVQLDEPIRMFAVKWAGKDIVIINPEIIKLSKQTCHRVEGCTSIRKGEAQYLVTRHKAVRIAGTDLEGEKVMYRVGGLFGEIMQHEHDHLEGRLIVDHGRDVS